MSEPGPYTELAQRLQALEVANQALQSIVSYLKGQQEGVNVPEVTISHDRLANGVWRYKTSVTLVPEQPEAMANTLAWADKVARDEALRREAIDQGRALAENRALGSMSNE